jgi:hypothetical protein
MKKLIAIIIVITAVVVSCSKSTSTSTTTVDCSGTAKSYATDVSPIITTYCATNSGCHGTGSSQGPGALTSYAQVYSARAAIRISVANGTMPQNTTLSAVQKNAILCWIDNGSSNN